MKRLLLLFNAIMLALAAYATPVVDIYQPSYKTAQQLQTSLVKLYGENLAVSVDGNQLLIRGEQAIVNEVQELLLQLDHAPNIFWVTINSSPTNADSKTYSTQHNKTLNTFRVSEGETLYLVRQKTQQHLQNIGWVQTSFREMPVQQEAIGLTVTSSQQTVSVDIALQTRINNQLTTTRNKVSGEVGQWLAVTTNPQQPNSKQYGTRRSDGDLYIKVTKE